MIPSKNLIDALRVLAESNGNNALMLEVAQALEKAETRYETIRTLSPREFYDLYVKSIRHNTPLDKLIDEYEYED